MAEQQPAGPTPAPPPALPHGVPITLEQAKRAAAAAEAEARKNGWAMAIAVAETSGALVYFQKMDNTQYGSIKIAQAKAETAAQFRRPTKVFTDALAGGHLFFLSFEGLSAAPGGLPLVSDGKLIGAIGVSGGSGHQDDIVAAAGAAVIK
jgi:glc operon protein GlcG